MTTETWLAGRPGQALAVVIGLLAVAVIWFGAVDPVWSWFDDRTLLLEQRQALLRRTQEVAATLPRLRSASEATAGHGENPRTIMLPGTNDAVAAADLQERVQKMAVAAGASLTAVETLPVTPLGRLHKVSLRINLNAPWSVLMDFVHAIRQSPTPILIDDVHFHSATVAAHPTVIPIEASMILYGFRPPETGSGT